MGTKGAGLQTRRAEHREYRHGRAPRRRKARIAVFAAAAVLVLVLIPVAVAAGFLLWLGSAYNSGGAGGKPNVISGDAFPAPSARPAPGADGAENILLLGSDTRGVLGDITAGTSTGERSDTMMLIHIPADRRNVQVISLMRDLWVPIPGHGQAKINAALSYGGVPLTVETVEDLLGARIDHVVVMDFSGFAAMSTALGGVEVDSPKAFTSKNMPGYTFAQGENVVSGQSALAFVRERYSFPDSDYQRVRDQQSFMKGLLKKVTSDSGVAAIPKLHDFVATTSRYVAVDSGFTGPSALGLALSLRNVKAGEVDFLTLPTLGTGTIAGQSIVKPDPDAISGIAKALRADDLDRYLVEHPVQSGQ